MPGADSLLKILLQEEGNAVSEASKSINNATQKVIGVKDSIVGYFGDDKSAKPTEKAASVKSVFRFVLLEIPNWNIAIVYINFL